MQAGIHLITLGVADLKKATNFYEEIFGILPMPWEGNISFFELPGTWLSLYPLELLAKDANTTVNKKSFNGITLARNLENKAAVDAFLEKAKKAGANIQKPAQETFWGGYLGYFTDLDEYYWEIAWNPHFKIS